jgi:hypothetical protein
MTCCLCGGGVDKGMKEGPLGHHSTLVHQARRATMDALIAEEGASLGTSR